MNDSLYIAATGMHAQQLGVETIANNLVNVTTPGYKAGRVNFQDLIYRETGRPAGGDVNKAIGSFFGMGVNTSGVTRNFGAGDMKQTGSSLDVAISGEGFFEIVMPDGSHAYTRGGTLQVTKDSFLATAQGYVFAPAIQVPGNTAEMIIAPDGKVMARAADQATAIEVGRFEMMHFANPSALKPIGNGMYLPTEGSGDAIQGRPGEDGLGTIAQGRLEGSNVKMVDEMVALMLTQRAYELSAKVVQVSDELMSMTNNLRRS